MWKATSVPRTNHSPYSLPVEALNLIVESKSLPVELSNYTIELHVPSRRKEKLAIILFCRFVVTLRDGGLGLGLYQKRYRAPDFVSNIGFF